MKKNNTAKKAAKDAKTITEALKDSTAKTLKEIMSEAISDMLMEEDEDEDEAKDDDSEKDTKEEKDNAEDSLKEDDVETVEDVEDEGADDEESESAEEESDEEDFDDEWSDMDKFKVGDNDYDFTGVEGDDDLILKVYNKLGDDDQIFVKKNEDGNYEVEDGETGAEYVIELNAEPEEVGDDGEEEFEFDFDGDDGEDEGGFDFDLDVDGDEDDDIELEFDGPEDDDEDTGIDIVDDVDDDEEDDSMLKEWDGEKNYIYPRQKETAMTTPSNNEPADKSSTYTMDEVPEGTDRRFGKKVGDGDPFGQKVNEDVEECGDGMNADGEEMLDEDGSGQNTKRSTKKSQNHIDRSAYNQRHSSQNGEYEALKTDNKTELGDGGENESDKLKESVRKIYNKAKLIQEENKKYKDCIKDIKQSLKEAAVLNVSLAQIVKLMCENTTTAEEKKSILKRFNNVKTVNESKDLYNTIKGELNEGRKTGVMLEKQISAAPGRTLNETTIYNSKATGTNPAIDLMTRMDNLWKK